ncbi:enoyl-CoA hydratase-related protein [Nakamurella leprariae]|uniref:Enoyl-CoA hydratase/isomerase family protein n=1 Tax=Nakamurella leprariae TaxID=2803911 RepID=A0A939C0S9_9ACTN|nr:enoyl-CoA hydratase-related protein [Nakamurella leprariae]MBM9466359.1 enoyl-CoA hydratase/isomerase family protein [Nakamurella leprariae]
MDPVDLTITEGLARLRLTRPEVGNAIGLATARALRDAAQQCRAAEVRAVLLTADGSNFCVGGDLREFASFGPEALTGHLHAVTDALHEAQRILADLDGPVVAAVQGAAAGAGFGLACGADVVLAGSGARFVSAYTAIGFSPDAGLTWTLTRAVGRVRASAVLLLNRPVLAAEAVEWGLVTEVVPDEELAARALELAGRLASGPTAAFGVVKRMVATATETDRPTRWAQEGSTLASAAASADGAEGVAAFLTKRPPVFTGGRPVG